VNAGFSVTARRNKMKFGPGVCFYDVRRYFFFISVSVENWGRGPHFNV
jgi:hypothetical protein